MLNYQNYNRSSSQICVSSLCQLLHSNVLGFFLFTCLDPWEHKVNFKWAWTQACQSYLQWFPQNSSVVATYLSPLCSICWRNIGLSNYRQVENRWHLVTAAQHLVHLSAGLWTARYETCSTPCLKSSPQHGSGHAGVLVMDCIGSTNPKGSWVWPSQKAGGANRHWGLFQTRLVLFKPSMYDHQQNVYIRSHCTSVPFKNNVLWF